MNRDTIDYPRRALIEFAAGVVHEKAFQINREDLLRFVAASGDSHPLHTNAAFAQTRGYHDVLVHGMCVAARCTAFVAEQFVGSHGLLVSMSADFRLPVFCDEPLTWRAEVLRVEAIAETVEIRWTVTNGKNAIVQRGAACAWLGGHG